MNNNEEALKKYAKGKEVHENDTSASKTEMAALLNNRGLSFQSLLRLDEALKDFNEATKWNKENPIYHCNKGNILFQLKREAESQKCFEQAL